LRSTFDLHHTIWGAYLTIPASPLNFGFYSKNTIGYTISLIMYASA